MIRGRTMNLIERDNLIIYIKNPKYERQIRKFGHIVYSNRKERYVSMYIDKEDTEKILQQLEKLKYVTGVLVSPYQELKRDYSSN